MTTNRQMAGGLAWRTSWPRNWARPPALALLGLALVGLAQAGCRSDGCTDCGLTQKFSNGVQALAARVTKHFDGCKGGADCGCGGETVVDAGVPMYSGGMVVPQQPGVIIQQSPGIDSPPTQLEAIPAPGAQPTTGTGASGTGNTTKSSPSGVKSSSYTTMTPTPKGTSAQRRGSDVARAVHSSQDPASSNDPLDNLPPVDLPSEATSKAAPVPRAAAAPATPAAAPASSPTANTTSPAPVAPGQDTTAPNPAEKVSAAEGSLGNLPPIETASPFQAPGIRRYASVAPSISGGSAPSVEGLDWLKEKGCRTFIDLRKSSEIDPNFVDAVNDRNMVYISLPIVANRLDVSRLARFDDLIAQSENRPVYFCDANGSRAALAWYIHLRVVGQEDAQSATSKAEEIGLTAVEVKLAEDYLAINKPKPRASTARVAQAQPIVETKAEPAPVAATNPPAAEAPRPALPSSSTPATNSPATATQSALPSTEPAPVMLPGEDRPQAANDALPAGNRLRDPAFWRPVAALLLTGIGVPLAYWSRSAITLSRKTKVRASLPGTVQSPSDLPAGSDA